MNKQRKTSNILNVFQYDDTTGIIGLNGVPVSGYGLYLHTNINDGSVGIDSSSAINAMYLLKSGTKNFEISYDTSGTSKIFRLLPYQSGSFFQIGNPSNAGADYVFIAESTYGNVLIGPGIGNATGNLTGATALTHKVQIHGATFHDSTVQATGFIITGGASTGFLKADGTVDSATYITGSALTGYATQSYVGTQIANLVAAAPTTLDTLNELAAALGNDPSFATTITTSIGTKVPQTRTITINGTSYDLSANRSWTINSMVYPSAGIALSTGTAWGTSITDNSSNWNTAYGWGNHASGGYLTSVTAATTYVSLTGSYANPAWITSLAYSKITGVPAFLTSYTETDPYRVTSVAVTGTSTKTITITRADASTVTTTWTDIDTDTNTYVTSAAFSGGTLTLTRNDSGTVSVSLDGRYYLATNPSGYLTGITSSQVTTALGYTPYNATNPSGYLTSITSSQVTTALGYTPYNGATNPNGYITGVTNITGYAAMLNTYDTRTISPSSHTAYRLSFGFTSWANNNTADWADFLHLRSYGDNSGGADNLVMFKKNGIGMRIWQQSFGSATAYSSYVDVYHTGNLTNLNQLSNGPGYITSYTETSTLANVTARGSSTTAGITVNGDMNSIGIVYSRANQTTAYTSAALWTQSFGSTLTGIAFHVSGVVGRMLHMNASTTDANLYWNGTALVYNSGTWGINITGNAATLGGYGPNQTGGANTIVQRDSNGYIQNSYFYSSGGGAERNASGMGYFAGHNTSDYYYRSYTAAAAASLLSGQSMNISGTATYATQLSWSGAGATVINANTFGPGILSNYYGGGQISNIPEGGYGSLINFGGYSQSSLAIQLYSVVNHNTTTPTRTLYFRMGNNLGFGNDWHTLLDASNYPYAANMNQYVRTTDNVNFNRVDATNYGVGNAIYFGGGNNYLNWSGGIHTNVSFISDTYVYGGIVRLGDMWGGNGLYVPSGTMVFGTESNNGWSFQSGAVQRAFFGGDGNLWMQWAGDYISNLLAAKQAASTAINTGNIGSQSVNYASTVGINYNNDSNSTYQLLWGSGNSIYGTAQVYVNPSSDVIYARGGFISPGNPWGTADSAYFPNGITTAGSQNWVYGSTYIGNAPSNGSGVLISSNGSSYFRSSNTGGTWGYAGQFVDRNSASNNYIPWSFENENGNHSWGAVARFHIQQANADRPSLQFSAMGGNDRWSIGYVTGSDYNFRITQNHGYRPDNSGNDGWGTERFKIDTSGNTYAAIGGTLYANGAQVITTSNIASQSVVTIQDAPPSGSAGRLWWESDTGKLKVYYGSAWVDASPIPDSSLFFAKAGGSITGDVSIGQTLNVVGNTLVQGTIYSFGDVIAYSSSDSRLKDNITLIESPLEKVSKINGVSFNWNDKQSAYEVGSKDIGVIAQEIEVVLPELVITRDNGYKAVRYEKIVALLIEAIKDQQAQINNLTDKLNNL